MKYSFTVPNGSYLVRLYFADNYTGTHAVGARVFDVSIEGQLVFNDIDMFQAVGPHAALIRSATVTVADGQINIQFLHQVEMPLINAIEIIQQSATPDTTPPSIPQGVSATVVSSSRIDLTWAASTDSGTGVAGYRIFRNGVAVATSATTSYSNTGLQPNTLYSFTVSAFDGASPANESLGSSPPVTATTLAGGAAAR